MSKDLDSDEVAQEYFDEVWEKMQVYKVRTDRTPKGKYLSKETNKEIEWENLTTRENYYESVSFEEFLLDQKNWDKSERYE